MASSSRRSWLPRCRWPLKNGCLCCRRKRDAGKPESSSSLGTASTDPEKVPPRKVAGLDKSVTKDSSLFDDTRFVAENMENNEEGNCQHRPCGCSMQARSTPGQMSPEEERMVRIALAREAEHPEHRPHAEEDGSAPPLEARSEYSVPDPETIALWMKGVYRRYNPAKVSSVDKVLHRYRGREEELIELVVAKYRLGPCAPRLHNDGCAGNFDDALSSMCGSTTSRYSFGRL
mmetsp:Transcript_91895/g.274188  ORF Transcript_91895/g.274188 Transcript_91895/m.274188 type:complete len:232 (-) Transcript_91895:56-751(-)